MFHTPADESMAMSDSDIAAKKKTTSSDNFIISHDVPNNDSSNKFSSNEQHTNDDEEMYESLLTSLDEDFDDTSTKQNEVSREVIQE